jgi:hypothetical protein
VITLRTVAPLLFALGACGDAQPPVDARSPDATASDGGAPTDAPTMDAAGGPRLDAGEVPDSDVPLRVLFVGNSYTYVNDLPAVVRALGDATPGAAVEVESVVEGGARLSDHWTTTGARERIAAGGFGAVVLQGQSVEPLTSTEDFQLHAQRLADAVHDAGARPVWYATWARRGGDPFYDRLESGGYPSAMRDRLETQYETAAARHGDVVARVGKAWDRPIPGLPPDVVLHAEDGSHPTAEGTLLAACVLLRAITGTLPRVPDPPPLGITRETAEALCAVVPHVVCDGTLWSCDGACVSLEWDRANCGACGVTCPGTLPCDVGECGCPIGLTACSDACVDVRTDPENCGACGTSCDASGMPCYDGTCACPSIARRDADFRALSARRPGCINWRSAECGEAVHEECAEHECFDSGFGPVPGAIMCVAGGVTRTTYTELATLVAACDGATERSGLDCSSAIHRHCVSTGAASGFGPVASLGDDVTVTCLESATLLRTDYATLASTFPMCDGTATRGGPQCNTASWLYCASMGHAGGFGPVEVSGTDVDVVCVGS